MKHLYLTILLIIPGIYLACAVASSDSKADGPSVPACEFDGYPDNIFCVGTHSDYCFACYHPNRNTAGRNVTQCWEFNGSKCRH